MLSRPFLAMISKARNEVMDRTPAPHQNKSNFLFFRHINFFVMFNSLAVD